MNINPLKRTAFRLVVTALVCGNMTTGLMADDRPSHADLTFDNGTHRGWYTRFWNGDCGAIPDGGEKRTCRFAQMFAPGDWNQTIDEFAAELAHAERATLQCELRRLGRTIGHEWARANDIRKIDTDDLQEWREILTDSAVGSPRVRIDNIRAAARAKLDRP